METITLAHSASPINLMALSNAELEAWFTASDFPVEVVANCGDATCPDCITVEPARAA
ncbi:MAG: hypothetical protein BMS9Abin12_0901 [Acidimicrobiia bacterium]|nr:MAG: hypothetical protein BMS9Abin12_0901 [Acidimicrobiia bacterium]